MSYLNRNRLKNFFINLKKYFKSEEFLNSMAISNAEIDSIANTAGYNDNGTGTVNYDFVPRSGGAVMTGNSLSRTVNNDEFRIDGGTSGSNGSAILLRGKDKTGNGGETDIVANDGTDSTTVNIKPNGTITRVTNNVTKNIAMAEDYVPRSGGAVMTGDLCTSPTVGGLMISGGDVRAHGGDIILMGKTAVYNPGGVVILPQVGDGQERTMWLLPNGTWTWSGTACQITSDQRLKQQINAIDDKLLDAWKDVAPVQFKYNDSVNEKGDKARLHTGYVVQQIAEACQNHDVNIDNYGLYCHEVYPERTEEVTITNEDGTTSKETKVIEEASEHYSLRYTEALIVECAFLRREVERLTERVTKLESRKKKTTS